MAGVFGTFNPPTSLAQSPEFQKLALEEQERQRQRRLQQEAEEDKRRAAERALPQANTETAADLLQRTAPQADPVSIETAEQAQLRRNQLALVNQLQERAAGRGPSIAELAAKQTQQRGLAQQQALVASARPGQQAAVARQAAQQSGALTGSLAGSVAQARAQEQQQAQQALAGVLQGTRGQDIGLAQQQALLGQRAGEFNVGAQLKQSGLNQQGFLALTQLLEQGKQAEAERLLRGDLTREQIAAGIQTAKIGQPSTFERVLGAGVGVGSLVAAFSDENRKENVQSGGQETDQFLNTLEPSTFNFRANPEQVNATPGSANPGPPAEQVRKASKQDAQNEREDKNLRARRVAFGGNLLTNAIFGREPLNITPQAALALRGRKKREDEEEDPAIGGAPPQRVGIMAQDVASTPAGQQAVIPTPSGLAIDPVQTAPLALAGLGRLNERLRKLENA